MLSKLREGSVADASERKSLNSASGSPVKSPLGGDQLHSVNEENSPQDSPKLMDIATRPVRTKATDEARKKSDKASLVDSAVNGSDPDSIVEAEPGSNDAEDGQGGSTRKLNGSPLVANNPYDPTIAFYNELLRKDVYLTFRLLCKLSMHTGTPQQNPADVDMTHLTPDDELSQVSIRARTLALELLLSVLNSCGPILQTEEIYVNLVRQHLCMSIARNGISPQPHLFELSISLFLVVIRLYRSRLVAEIEILINTVYIHILEMGNSTFKQKGLVLEALEKICGDPQTILDLFLNYDCDLGCVSIFERIVNVCARCAQGGRGNPSGDAPEDGNWTKMSPKPGATPLSPQKGLISGFGGMRFLINLCRNGG